MPKLAGHYLELHVSTGKEAFERIYLPLVRIDETVEEATERWLDRMTAGRKRNIAKARGQLRGRVILARIARPSSYYRAQAEAAGLDYEAGERPKGKTTRRRGR